MHVFSFHRINPNKNPLWPAIHPDLFYKQIKYLRKKYTIVNLEKYLGSDSYPKDIKNLASVVFDDGYKDIMEYALPVLDEFDIVPSIYIVTNVIDENRLIWTFLLDSLFINTNKNKLSLILDSKTKEYQWMNQSKKLILAKQLKIKLKHTDGNHRKLLLDSIEKQFNDVQLPESPYLSWDELRLLKNKGFEIGSHTANHELLDQIDNDEELKYELNHSAQRIKNELDEFPKTISYPNGNYNNKVIDLAKASGYSYGLAVKQKPFNPEKDSLFEIPRIELYNEPMWKTKLRVNGTITQIKSILGK
jgi:peptidoglycan/xylan/chitin deacetylase (PgdA/CDA1 family)